eukprot:COSAG01_NODE_29800_length_629_cov_1.054717_2_plen_26_part_01
MPGSLCSLRRLPPDIRGLAGLRSLNV